MLVLKLAMVAKCSRWLFMVHYMAQVSDPVKYFIGGVLNLIISVLFSKAMAKSPSHEYKAVALLSKTQQG